MASETSQKIDQNIVLGQICHTLTIFKPFSSAFSFIQKSENKNKNKRIKKTTTFPV